MLTFNRPSMNDGRYRIANPPLYRASTILFDDVAHLLRSQGEMVRGERASIYATFGTPTTRALADLVTAREQGVGTVFAPSGLGAVTLALLALLRSGDHLLMVDSAYGPTRGLCERLLRRGGVEAEYYDPGAGGRIASLIRTNTRAIFMESPGSFTFDVQDVPAIVAAAQAAERASGEPLYTIIDNGWGSPGLFVPLALGVDVSIVPLTKYWGGHADFVLGGVVASRRSWKAVRGTAWDMGLCASADDAALALRGARSVDVRLREHARSALAVAERLRGHRRVGTVLHPALPGSPGHELWKRDFAGSNGLLAFELLNEQRDPANPVEAAKLADALVRSGAFGLGYSWGSFESLVMPGVLPDGTSHMERKVTPWTGGTLMRLHIGLDPVEQLIAALDAALDAALAH